MPRVSCVVFAAKHIDPNWVKGKSVLDVGACDFNGSIRPLLESWGCESYLGIDMIEGPGVDQIVNADELIETFGENSFDLVISLEMMEHTRYWQTSLHNMKRVCKPEGMLIITAPAPGYQYHGYPTDFWRYTQKDWRAMLADFDIISTEFDPQGPGSFVSSVKRAPFEEKDLSNYALFSVVTGTNIPKLEEADFNCGYFKRTVLKIRIKEFIEGIYRSCGRIVTKLFGIRQ